MTMEKYGFIYLWYDRKRKMFYLGCHWGTKNDGYICSSNRMRDAYRRRPQDFKRRIVQTNIERNALLDEEYKWLKLINEHELGKRYYNLRQHRWGHWSTDTNNSLPIRQKLSNAMKKRIEQGNYLNSSHWKKGNEPWNKGKTIGPQEQEVIEKRANSNRKKRGPYKGAVEYSGTQKRANDPNHIKSEYRKPPSRKGISHSDETKKKLSEKWKQIWNERKQINH